MKYITREGGATVTIFVPYDCNNHCPFCINKAEYADTSKFDINEIIKSIKIMDAITPYCDFVFTGGEPLANLEMLQMMLDVIPHTHKVFINTTLPAGGKYSEEDVARFLNTNYEQGNITGINVSRHLKKYVQECLDEIFNMIRFQTRINCVLYKSFEPKEIIDFVERFRKYTTYIQFRRDYCITTLDNLYDEENDVILKCLKNSFRYVGPFGQYRMRCAYEFDYDGYKITYHKTLPYSKLPALYKEGTKDEIPMADPELNLGTFVLYDIIIKQNGAIKDDWDVCNNLDSRVCDKLAKPLDLDAYRHAKFEEYK